MSSYEGKSNTAEPLVPEDKMSTDVSEPSQEMPAETSDQTSSQSIMSEALSVSVTAQTLSESVASDIESESVPSGIEPESVLSGIEPESVPSKIQPESILSELQSESVLSETTAAVQIPPESTTAQDSKDTVESAFIESEENIKEATETKDPIAVSETDKQVSEKSNAEIIEQTESMEVDAAGDDNGDIASKSIAEEIGQETSNGSVLSAEETALKSDEEQMEVTSGIDASSGEVSVNGDSQIMPPPQEVPPVEIVENCYCGKKRNIGTVELQCASCYKWFHDTCIKISTGRCLPFMTYYTFFCKVCNPSGIETFSKKQPNFTHMCATTLANLTHLGASEENRKSMFSKDKEIIPFIEAKWEYLTSMPRRIKQTWHSTVHKVMLKDSDMFSCEEKPPDYTSGSDYPIFGLVNQDLSKIAPSYDSMGRGGLQKQIQDMTQTSGFTSSKGRGAKRRFFGEGQIAAGKKVKSDLVMPKLPPNGYPSEHPFNKDGYRYILAEPDEHAPFRQEFDESQDWAGKPIPGWLYRKLMPNNVLLALHDRAPQLRVSEERLVVTGEKGYCMIRASHGVSWGTWYYEVNIDDMPDGAATRLGWSQGLANLQAPLGYDKFSYSWRSRKGTKFHESRGYHFANDGYGHGDTVGFLIHLPQTTEHIPLPPIFKDKPLVKFKSYLYYEEKDESQLELKRLKPLHGSKIKFFKNGKLMGTAFEDIHKGIYFPAASLYKSCSISFNFGPTFKFPPKEEGYKSMHQAALDSTIEQTMTDLLYFTENKGKLRLDNIV